MKSVLLNEQRKEFRRWSRARCEKIEKAADFDAALTVYCSTLDALHLIQLLFPNEPLELTKGNLEMSLQMVFDKIVEDLK